MCVKFLSILHNELPSEPLSGFRERFMKLYSELKQFYASCLNIHFLRQIVSIPKMPENPPDFHSSIPNFNQHHETLQQANVVPVRPPSPVEIESETLIDISHGLDDLNVQEFQEHSQIDRMQSQIENLRSELSESKREQVVEVTKLLEHISSLDVFFFFFFFREARSSRALSSHLESSIRGPRQSAVTEALQLWGGAVRCTGFHDALSLGPRMLDSRWLDSARLLRASRKKKKKKKEFNKKKGNVLEL
jgi:hypothetical protein